MKNTRQFLNHFIIQTVKIITLILSVWLFAAAFFTTGYAPDMNTRINHFAWDNILLSLICLIPAIGILFLLTKACKCIKSFPDKLLLIVLFLYGIGGCLLVLFSKTAPAGDPMVVYSMAEQFANNYLAAIHPTDSYLSFYPHQIGLVGYYEVLLRIWNLLPIDLVGYHFIKLANIVWVLILIVFFYQSVKLLFHNDKIQTAYLFLILINAPLLIFTSFVYGEIPSIGILSVGLWCVIKIFTNQLNSRKELFYLIPLSILCLAGAVALRKNTLVILIAIFLVTFFTALFQKRYWLILLSGSYILAGMGILPLIQALYEYRAGNVLNDGVPALAFIAMGMQGDGWYNAYNFNTYLESGLDKSLTDATALDAIRLRLSYFKENLSECFRFYLSKFQSQWCDGTYGSMQATQATAGGRGPFFEKLYFGSYHYVYIFLCNVFQNLLYLGNLIFAVIFYKKESKESTLIYYLCPIAVLGAFLFHTLWEANSRYIFHSGLLLLPTASLGLGLLANFVGSLTIKKEVHTSTDTDNEAGQ